MLTPIEKNLRETDVEKSRFIAVLFPISDVEQIKDILLALHKEYPGARHYPYAARIGPFSKSSDDGEPSGTAGRPLTELLTKKEIDNAFLAVVRYFGGTKLGAGRLLRTYVDAGKAALDSACLGAITEANGFRVTLSYANFEDLRRFASECHAEISDIVYNEMVEMTVYGLALAREDLISRYSGAISVSDLSPKRLVTRIKE